MLQNKKTSTSINEENVGDRLDTGEGCSQSAGHRERS